MIASPPRGRPQAGNAALISFSGRTVATLVVGVAAEAGPAATAARGLGERLAAERLGLPRPAVRLATLEPSGRPVILVHGRPARAGISVSHVEGLVAAAFAEDGGVGIDLVDPAEAGRSLDWWFTPDELALEPDEGLLRARLWAAKEAAYKAAALDEELRPRTVTIESLSPGSFAWSAHGRFTTAAGGGRFLAVGRHVVAVAASIPQPFTPEIASA
jgi:hypothetical protein